MDFDYPGTGQDGLTTSRKHLLAFTNEWHPPSHNFRLSLIDSRENLDKNYKDGGHGFAYATSKLPKNIVDHIRGLGRDSHYLNFPNSLDRCFSELVKM